MKKLGSSPVNKFEEDSHHPSVINKPPTVKKSRVTHSKLNINNIPNDDDLFIPKNSNIHSGKLKPKKKRKNEAEDQVNEIFDTSLNPDIESQFNSVILPSEFERYSKPHLMTSNNTHETNIEESNTKPNLKHPSNNFVIANITIDDDSPDDENDVLKISPWSIFVSIYKPIFTKMFPDESKVGIYRRLQKKWDEFDETDKKVYIDKADYRNRAMKRQNRKEIRIRNKEKKDRKTVSPYSLYVAERHKALKSQQPELSLSERALMIANEWRSMSSVEKHPFSNLAKRRTRQMNKQSSDDSELDN